MLTNCGLTLENDRVRRNTAADINRRIDTATSASIQYYAKQPEAVIDRRIQELSEEWDIERVIESQASTLALVGLGLAVGVNRKWLYFSGAVLGFLLLHSLHGWCPPVPVLRRLGLRTRREIDHEKAALHHLRGDFDPLHPTEREHRRLAALVDEA